MKIEANRIAAGTAKAIRLSSGQSVMLVLADGPQVVDTWAFCSSDMSEFMSMAHTRSCIEKISPSLGDVLYTNCRRPILKIVEDTSMSGHDTLLSACDTERYRLLGFSGDYHRNCVDNFHQALSEIGVSDMDCPDPLNIFENVSIDAGGKMAIVPPVAGRDSSIRLQALRDLVVVFSACPMDMVFTNGLDMKPKDVCYEIR